MHVSRPMLRSSVMIAAPLLALAWTGASTTQAENPLGSRENPLRRLQPESGSGLATNVRMTPGLPTSASFRPIENTALRLREEHTEDHYAPNANPANQYSNVQRAAYMQGGGPTMPPGLEIPSLDAPTRIADPPPSSYGATPEIPGSTQTNPPRGLNTAPAVPAVPPASQAPNGLMPRPANTSPTLSPPPPQQSQPMTRGNSTLPTANDQTPIAPPQLPNQWATVGNCNLISPPSTHQAGFWGCGPPVANASGNPYRMVPPTTMPNDPRAMAVTGDVGLRPLCNLCRTDGNVVVGQGVLGQPKAYVAGQSVRNFLRYLTP